MKPQNQKILRVLAILGGAGFIGIFWSIGVLDVGFWIPSAEPCRSQLNTVRSIEMPKGYSHGSIVFDVPIYVSPMSFPCVHELNTMSKITPLYWRVNPLNTKGALNFLSNTDGPQTFKIIKEVNVSEKYQICIDSCSYFNGLVLEDQTGKMYLLPDETLYGAGQTLQSSIENRKDFRYHDIGKVTAENGDIIPVDKIDDSLFTTSTTPLGQRSMHIDSLQTGQ